MWNPQQKRDREIPYRGEPSRKYSRRQRQIRDLKTERRQIIITIVIIVVFMVIISSFIIFSPNNTNSAKIEQGFIFITFTLILIVPIIAGFKSINKFRKGYDVDISEEADKDKELEESKNSD